MRILKLLGLIEEYGEGVDRMYHEMEARLMKPPVFTAPQSSVTVTIHNRFLVDVEDHGAGEACPPGRGRNSPVRTPLLSATS